MQQPGSPEGEDCRLGLCLEMKVETEGQGGCHREDSSCLLRMGGNWKIKATLEKILDQLKSIIQKAFKISEQSLDFKIQNSFSTPDVHRSHLDCVSPCVPGCF